MKLSLGNSATMEPFSLLAGTDVPSGGSHLSQPVQKSDDALNLHNNDRISPLDLALANNSTSDAVVLLLEGCPPPPELSRRQQTENYMERANILKCKLNSFCRSGGWQGRYFKDAVAAV